MKFSIQGFFSKWDFFTFSEEILNGKLPVQKLWKQHWEVYAGLTTTGARLHTHLITHLKFILGALLSCSLNITIAHFVFRLKKFKYFFMVFGKFEQLSFILLTFLWKTFKTSRRVDDFVLKLITNYNLIGNPRS